MNEYEQSLDNVILNLHHLNNGFVDEETHNFNPVCISNLVPILVPKHLHLDIQESDAHDMVVVCLASLGTKHLLSNDGASTTTVVRAFKGAPPSTAAAPKTFSPQSLKAGLAAQLALSIESRIGKNTLLEHSSKFRDL
jgi:hypothetical protein